MKLIVSLLLVACLWNGVHSVLSFLGPADGDAFKNTAEIILEHGFAYEQHNIETRDGYILPFYRIVNRNQKPMSGRPFILQHGLTSSSIDFIINAAYKESDYNMNATSSNIGFEFAKRGYDVWLANSRGNAEALGHKTLKSTDSKFWDFSFDEMIKYDVPDSIDYVLKKTNSTTLGYVGHSQGSMIMFGLLSEQKKYNDIVKPFIALGPVAAVGHITTPLKAVTKVPYLLDLASKYVGPFTAQNSWSKRIIDMFCRSPVRKICSSLIFFGMGWDSPQTNMTRLPVILTHFPSGTSMKDVVHFMMNVKSQKFNKYDYGGRKNMEVYGQKTPATYNLANIVNKDIALFSAVNDPLSNTEDVQILRKSMGVAAKYDRVVDWKQFNHLDFLYAIDVKTLILPYMLQWAKDYDQYV